MMGSKHRDLSDSSEYTIENVSTSRGLFVSIKTLEGTEIGRATFVRGPNYLEADDSDLSDSVWVHPEYRRRGLASTMYNYAEAVSGQKIIPSEHSSGLGAKFWASRAKRLHPDHPAHEWLGDLSASGKENK
jgi:GNAT superfamily N-acetyltransferase